MHYAGRAWCSVGAEEVGQGGEVYMLARKVAARLKPNSVAAFTRLLECEVLPWLREQEGFLDLITLAARDGREVATITFWDHKRNVQAYNSGGCPDALMFLGEMLDGTASLPP